MESATSQDQELARAFGLGTVLGAQPLRTGHIHETRILGCDGGRRFLLQRLNTAVFREPETVMDNLVRITGHLRRRLEAAGVRDAARRVLTVLPAADGARTAPDRQGRPWRCFAFLEDTRSVDQPESPEQARRAGRAFGAFAAALEDMEPPPADTIPHFHDFARRWAALEVAAGHDAAGRGGAVGRELESTAALYAEIARRHDLRGLPVRVVHNDCKLNNLLFDATSGEALCVIDLDTVMRGSLVFDFGELVRTAACRAPEDERDLSRLRPEPRLLEALARGYREGVRPMATPAELEALPLAGARLALENAMRFLTDHLEGDFYFAVHRPGHNLDRHRAQRCLAERLLAAEAVVRDALAQAPPPLPGPGAA